MELFEVPLVPTQSIVDVLLHLLDVGILSYLFSLESTIGGLDLFG